MALSVADQPLWSIRSVGGRNTIIDGIEQDGAGRMRALDGCLDPPGRAT